ncbi:MAG TPA: class I SAM-dependent methyltransferase [Streptosporangiaceae bacterium]
MDEDGYFGAEVAARYDAGSPERFADDELGPTVELLAELAAGGPALEFAIGTGRVALPLAARGVPVHGIDVSRAMVAELRAKPGGADLPVTIGDIAATRAGAAFTLVYLVFNTVNNLTTQDAQVACFANAAAHLAPGGRFLVEVGVPDLRRLPPGQSAVPFHVAERSWGFDTYDPATQAMTSHHIAIDDGRARHTAVPFRYVWPSELDLMARLAGLRPEARWAGWHREPFTSDSTRHVSVWEKPRA